MGQTVTKGAPVPRKATMEDLRRYGIEALAHFPSSTIWVGGKMFVGVDVTGEVPRKGTKGPAQ